MAANSVMQIGGLRPGPKLAETTLRATGRITAATAAMLEGRLQELIPEFRRIVLDLSSVEYIDNSGVALLANVYARARQADCDLEIGNPKRRLRDRVRNWLDSALQGHEEYLGVTPD